jgi:hypothetical protein
MWFVCFVLLVLFIWVWRSQEPFSVHFKVDADPLQPIQSAATSVLGAVKYHSDNMRDSVLSFVPFKDKFRRWHRKWRGKNI